MVEISSWWTGQKSLSPYQIKQLKKRMQQSFDTLPTIVSVSEKTKKFDENAAEKELDSFLSWDVA